MLNLWAHRWWLLSLRGLLAVIFGFLAIIWPEITLHVLIILFGAYVLLDGLFALFASLGQRRRRGLFLLEAFVGLGVGILTFIWPRITELVLLYLIAGWALVTGVVQMAVAFMFRRVLQSEWMLELGGLLSVVFGLLLILYPISGAVAIVWLIGLYAILSGLLLFFLGLRLQRL